ncbi:DUF1499 domain-containing protein [Salinivibrio kushneri]|uniref:DUF1499 domain-containing protein n=1 Tax=Salinivibrio kushneri TaxID=1908198 RepID=UPI0015E0ECCA|nr:DUF1499 domain-containing protein [Salinivibrio kushneri]
MAKQPPVTACGDSPNCVSTEDTRATFQLAPLRLANTDVALANIVEKITSMPRAELVSAQDNYAHLRFTTRVLRFVDDVEVSLNGGQIALRSASRVGYYDFGANRRRADAIRRTLLEAKLVTPSGAH